jgi:hypothetical protein
VVIVKVCIANGDISSVTLLVSSGHKELDDSAVANMRTKDIKDHLLSNPPTGHPAAWCKDMKVAYATKPHPPDGARAP